MNDTIHLCFERISKEDREKFVRKFQQQTPGEQQTDLYFQRTHTFRELILGGHLCWLGLCARYEWPVDAQKPDWSIVGEHQKLTGIVEVMSLHADTDVEDEFWKAGRVYDGRSDNDRLYRIREKISRYKSLVEKNEVPFAMAVFLQPPAVVQRPEHDELMLGLFKSYPELSGVLFFSKVIWGTPSLKITVLNTARIQSR